MILLDVWLDQSNADGIDILKVLKKSYPYIPVIMISGHGTIDMAINALKIGAFDFIEKPFDSNILIMSITRAIEISELKRQNSQLLKDNNCYLTCNNYKAEEDSFYSVSCSSSFKICCALIKLYFSSDNLL